MEEVLRVVEDTFYKSAITDLKSYLRENSHHKNWLMYSDYCIGDKNKPNDVVSFTLMPYDDYPNIIKERISLLAPTDIKDKRKINPDFIAYLKERRLFHISFILGSRKGLSQADGFVEKDLVMISLTKTCEMLDEWCDNTPSNAEYFKAVKEKLRIARGELSKKSANYSLFRDVLLVSLLAGYISYMFTKFNKAKRFGWFSDRDKIIEVYDRLIADLFPMNHHSLCERDSIDSSGTEIAFGVPQSDKDGKGWYDEMNRLPDHIAGTLADWDIHNNLLTKSKFVEMMEDCIADNSYLVIFRLVLEPKLFQCARVLVSKRERV